MIRPYGILILLLAQHNKETVAPNFYILKTLYYMVSNVKSNDVQALAGREDAYFISHNNNWLGVADGVSQWSFEGTF